MAEYNFLFADCSPDLNLSEETAEDSGIDEELECLLYSQIHYNEAAPVNNDETLPIVTSEYLSSNKVESSPEKRKAEETEEVVKKKKKSEEDVKAKKKKKLKTDTVAKTKKKANKVESQDAKTQKKTKAVKKEKSMLDTFLVRDEIKKPLYVDLVDSSEESRSKAYGSKKNVSKRQEGPIEKQSLKRKRTVVEHVTLSSDNDSDDVIILDRSRSSSGVVVSDSSDSDVQIVSPPAKYDITTNMKITTSSMSKKHISERQSVQEVLDSLGDCDWSVNCKRIHTPNRYYTEKDKMEPKLEGSVRRRYCSKCDKVHLNRSDCKKRKPRCSTCCSEKHLRAKCPEVNCTFCQTLHKAGSCKVDCYSSKKRQLSRCKRCDFKGHPKSLCTDTWRQFHLTTSNNNVPESSHPKSNKINPNMYCCNCASRRHFDYDCPLKRMYHWIPTICPIISSYDKYVGISSETQKNKKSACKASKLPLTAKKQREEVNARSTKKEKKEVNAVNTKKGKHELYSLNTIVKKKKKKEVAQVLDSEIIQQKKKKKKKKKSSTPNASLPSRSFSHVNNITTEALKTIIPKKLKLKVKKAKPTATFTSDNSAGTPKTLVATHVNSPQGMKVNKVRKRKKNKKSNAKKTEQFENLTITIQNN